MIIATVHFGKKLVSVVLVSKTKVGSILDFSFNVGTDTGQKTSDSISILSILIEMVKIQRMSQKKKTPRGRVG